MNRCTFEVACVALVIVAAASFPAQAANPWTVSTSISSTGERTTTLSNASGGDAAFVVFCTSGGAWGYYLSTSFATSNGSVRYRIGPGALRSETWIEASASPGQTLTPPSYSFSLLREIYLNWDVVFQYNAMSLGSRTVQMNASGFSEALDQTRAACNWPNDVLPPENGWGKPLPSAPPPDAVMATYVVPAVNQFPWVAWRAHNADGKPQVLVRLGDKAGPCTGPLPITDHRFYVTQGDKIVSAVSGTNFEIDCLMGQIIVALNGDFDAGKALTLNSYQFQSTATDPASAIASVTFDDQIATIVTLIEYYNASLDHYFLTWVPIEIAILDAGVTIKGWVRTGKTIPTYTMALNATSPVCRYYIPPDAGDSHFYGRGQEECDNTGRMHPNFILEDPKFMQMYMPVVGVCPLNTIEVYRVFNGRIDANHRYMIDKATRDMMVAKGWRAEGDGPNLVVMCAPV